MSINNQKVIDLCKKQKGLVLYTTDQGQWIATGAAVYPFLCEQQLSPATLRAVYSIPEEVNIREEKQLPNLFNFEDVEEGEKPAVYEPIQLSPIGGAICLKTRDGVKFVDPKYLKPLEAGKNGESVLYERASVGGYVYIVAKQGMMAEAIIMPAQGVITEGWLDDLAMLLEDMRQTFEKEADGHVG